MMVRDMWQHKPGRFCMLAGSALHNLGASLAGTGIPKRIVMCATLRKERTTLLQSRL